MSDAGSVSPESRRAVSLRLLVLGGTTEASRLASAIASRPDIAAVLSFAGRTANPVVPPIPYRIGGFGGVDGLLAFLTREDVGAVVDATHPFAARISANALEACRLGGVPVACFARPSWSAGPGDRWRPVRDIAAAIESLGPDPRRVFLTTGRLDLAAFKAAPHHHYLIRTIEPPDPAQLPPDCVLVRARGPFSADQEEALMRAEAIELLVTKNSGAVATAAKLTAARRLGLPVIMIERPSLPERLVFHDLDAVLTWIDNQRGVSSP